MYHKIGIQKLSPAQISKFLNGHAITIKHGSHHEIPVSSEQHKKIHSAHKKGKGVRITADPYQRDMMHAEGVFDHIRKAINHVIPHAKHLYHQHKEQIHKYVKPIAHRTVDRVHEYIKPAVHHHLGEHGTRHLGNLAHYAHREIGHGIHKHKPKARGRPRKHASHGEGPFEDFFTKTIPNLGHQVGESYEKLVGVNPFDEGFRVGNEIIGPALFGEGTRRGRKSHGGSLSGGALMPAGYGAGRRGRRGKGDIGRAIGSELGNLLPW